MLLRRWVANDWFTAAFVLFLAWVIAAGFAGGAVGLIVKDRLGQDLFEQRDSRGLDVDDFNDSLECSDHLDGTDVMR